MNEPCTIKQPPPPKPKILIAAALASLLLAACALSLSATSAHAAENKSEPGTVYVQHRFSTESGTHETTPHRAYATYTADRKAYTARVNASFGAVAIEGCWRVVADGIDITDKCSYDAEAGLVEIPKSYMHTTVHVIIDLDAEQSVEPFETNISIVAGDDPGQSTRLSMTTTAGTLRFTTPVPGTVKAVTQDSRVLDASEYSVADGELVIEGRTALSGSITVYLEGYAPEIADRNPIKDYNDTLIQRSLRSASRASIMARSDFGGWFDGWGWIWSTNQGPGDWDYTDYTMTWNGRTIYLNCCEHGILHMPQSSGNGGSVYFTASRTSSNVVSQYDTYDATTIYHHNVWRNTYYVYVDAGYYQDVDGYWSEDYETVTTSPRLGGVDLAKKSANSTITDGNLSYSTAGAVYGIFSDASCTYQLNSMTTDSSGKASLWGFYAGATVYIKETKPSPGYDLDKAVYKTSIVADQWSHVNGGTVYEPPKTATVRFFCDGDSTPVHSITRPLGTSFATSDPDVRKAAGIATKPNCTPGLDAWYYDSGYSSKFAGKTLDSDLNLYARNIATVTYAPTAGSALTEDLPFRKTMSESPPLLDVARDVLPPSRQADWGRKITLKEPRLKTLYYYDGERWRTLRWRGDGWYSNSAATGSAVKTLEVLRDTKVYGDWSRSTYDGIYSW